MDARASLTTIAALASILAATSPTSAEPGSTTPKVLEPGHSVSVASAAKKRAIEIDVTSDRIIPDNVRAMGAIYAAATLDELSLFDVVDRIVDAFVSGQLPIQSKTSHDILNAYAKARPDRVSKTARGELGAFAGGASQSVFDGIVRDSIRQMEAYAALVQAVSESLDQFRRDNVSESQERDRLADKYPEGSWNGPADLALSLSNLGYGAARSAAPDLDRQMKDANAIVSDPAVIAAHGVKTRDDLIAKLGGKSPAEVDRLTRRATAGSQLIASLADNAELLKVPGKRHDLARRVAAAAPSAKTWLAVKPIRVEKSSPKTLRPLCFDENRNVVPCAVTKK